MGVDFYYKIRYRWKHHDECKLRGHAERAPGPEVEEDRQGEERVQICRFLSIADPTFYSWAAPVKLVFAANSLGWRFRKDRNGWREFLGNE